MHLLHATTHLETRGFNHHTNLIVPHATTIDAAKILSHNRAMMVANREVANEEVAAEGTLPIEGVTKTMGLMTIRGVATTLTPRAVPITIGEILGTDPSQRHALPRLIHVTW